MSIVRCAECRCAPQECAAITVTSRNYKCIICKSDDICCCYPIHNDIGNSELTKSPSNKPNKTMESSAQIKVTYSNNNCCSNGSCKNDDNNGVKLNPGTRRAESSLTQFFKHVKEVYAVALGIEILCIAAAEIGENTGLHLFGFNAIGIPIAYAMGYALAGFTTFVTIFGRYNNGSPNETIDSCCSVLEQATVVGFIDGLKMTFRNFVIGITRLPQLRRQPNLKYVLKTSMYILLTAESACILTAETVGLIFYQYSILLSLPLALLAGAFTVVVPEAYRRTRKPKAI